MLEGDTSLEAARPQFLLFCNATGAGHAPMCHSTTLVGGNNYVDHMVGASSDASVKVNALHLDLLIACNVSTGSGDTPSSTTRDSLSN